MVRVSGPTGLRRPVQVFPGRIGGVRHEFNDEDEDESAMVEAFGGSGTCDLCMWKLHVGEKLDEGMLAIFLSFFWVATIFR